MLRKQKRDLSIFDGRLLKSGFGGMLDTKCGLSLHAGAN